MENSWIITALILIVALLIVISLGNALYHLISGKERTKTAKSLTIRITLSITLFLLLIISFAAGWIKPHGISANISEGLKAKSTQSQPVDEDKQE
jgi:formate hydrogenlyase subunit 3/multisubunit Na+/H+ antiporter MnhD subunit